MKFTTILAAAAISALPMIAGAVSVSPTVTGHGLTTSFNFGILDGDLTAANSNYVSDAVLDVAASQFFAIEFEAGASAGTLSLDVTNSGLPSGNSVEANLTLPGSTAGVYSLFLDGVLKASVPDGAAAQSFSFNLATGATSTLKWDWSAIPVGQLGQVSTNIATTVPLPAGVLLMGTALAGFGVMRRKSKKTA